MAVPPQFLMILQASQIRVKVGYPMTPDTEVSYSIWQYYSTVSISNDTFFQNALRADTAEQIRKWQKLGKRRDPGSWEMWAQTVNAYFNPPANEIVFPAGILREPWFDREWPGYLKYGAAGSIVSHELTVGTGPYFKHHIADRFQCVARLRLEWPQV